MEKKTLVKRILIGILAGFVVIAFARSIGIFDDGLPYVEITHGNHIHYLVKDRDEGIGMDDCPTRAPAADEVFSRQCQLIRKVVENGTTYYVPEGAQEGVPVTAFPTRMPASGERISATGEITKH